MDPDLVGAAGLQPAPQQGGRHRPVVAALDLGSGCGPGARRPGPGSGSGRASERPSGASIRPAVRFDGPWHQGQVLPPHLPAGQLRDEAARAPAVRATTSRPDVPLSSRWTMPGRSRSSAVRGLGQLGQVGEPGQQPVHQGARPVAGPGMDHQTGRLVDHDHLVVAHTTGTSTPGSAPRTPAGRPPRVPSTDSRSPASHPAAVRADHPTADR